MEFNPFLHHQSYGMADALYCQRDSRTDDSLFECTRTKQTTLPISYYALLNYLICYYTLVGNTHLQHKRTSRQQQFLLKVRLGHRLLLKPLIRIVFHRKLLRIHRL